MRIGRDKRGQHDVVYGITDAPKPLSEDIRSRESKYLMAMGIRIVAFLLIVILPIAWPWKLGLAVMALVLPYVAVVYANGGREPEPGADSPYRHAQQQALLPGRSGLDAGPDTVQGSGQEAGHQAGRDAGPDRDAEPRDTADSAPNQHVTGRIVGDDD